jgi:F-type H+-transporting ATPase subunit gamma
MPKGDKEIRGRIRSVKSTQQITRAMKMVASAKLKKSQSATERAHPYVDTMLRVIDHLVRALPDYEHPLLQKAENAQPATLFIVFTGDKGLCGSFNSNLVRQAEHFIARNPGREFLLVTVGKYSTRYFKRRGFTIEEALPSFDFGVKYYALEPLYTKAEQLFTSGRVEDVWLLYSRFITPSRQTPTLLKLLPVEHEGLTYGIKRDDELTPAEEDLIFEPSPRRVLDQLLPRFMRYSLFSAVRETYTSENAARMLAMDNATKAAGEMIDNLTLAYNKARQQAITLELLDICGGAEALKG